ncbi:MAG: MFS transporter, partial [Sandaracinaceae bacterium]|nr:MFS transporter [Sandaracinaceae bacterium]
MRTLAEQGLEGVRRAIAIVSVLSAVVLVVLDAAITNVALPAIARSLAVSPSLAVRVVTTYQLALVMALLPMAALGDSRGHRRVHAAGVAVFTAASALCALAPTLEWLLVARFLQGLGGAAILSLSVSLLRSVVSPSELGTAIGWNSLAVASGAAMGPTIGALVLSAAGWPWLFAVNVPLGVAVLLATRALPEGEGSGRGIDLGSVALNGATFAALVLGAELLPLHPVPAVALLAVSVASLFALVRRETSREAPLIPLDLLRSRSFRVSVAASITLFVGQSAAVVALPFYLQRDLGLSALRTGLLITPWPVAVAVVAPLAGKLADRVSGAVLCAIGGALLSIGLALLALWPMHGRPLLVVPLIALC